MNKGRGVAAPQNTSSATEPASSRTAPLSFGQQRLWFLEQLDPGTPKYHVSFAYHIEGPLDRGSLENGLTELVARHDALRTRFEMVDDEPVQVVDAPTPFVLEVVDLTSRAEADRLTEALEQGGQAALRPFDLFRGPLV